MSIFDDYVQALTDLGGALVSAAQAMTAPSGSPQEVAAYNAANVDIQVARAVAAYAAKQTGDAAKKAVDAAQHMVETAKQSLVRNIGAGVDAVKQDVRDGFATAADLAAQALKGVHDTVVHDLEVWGLFGLAAVGLLLYAVHEANKPESQAAMRKFILANEGFPT